MTRNVVQEIVEQAIRKDDREVEHVCDMLMQGIDKAYKARKIDHAEIMEQLLGALASIVVALNMEIGGEFDE